jgi:hypothetical protein
MPNLLVGRPAPTSFPEKMLGILLGNDAELTRFGPDRAGGATVEAAGHRPIPDQSRSGRLTES